MPQPRHFDLQGRSLPVGVKARAARYPGQFRKKEAIDLFIYRIGRELGSLAATMRGLDAVMFTGGIGEHSASLRERVCRDAAWLGVDLDQRANEAHGPRLSTAASRVAAWAIPTDEELMIARHTRHVLGNT